MDDKRRRTRTGCLTCRTRRIKCDERKPTCERCETANVECTGYTEKRRVMVRRPNNSSATVTSASPSTEPEHQCDATPYLQLRTDGLPLIGIPNNPTSLQRPHARARDVLAYHQFIFRTMPIIFPEETLSYWRDYVCQEAWEVQYVYNAIVALGSMHRATLLLSTQINNDCHRGFDTKVIAIQAYANALQSVSDNLACNQISMALLLGVLILFAYVEVKALLWRRLSWVLTITHSASTGMFQRQCDTFIWPSIISKPCAPGTAENRSTTRQRSSYVSKTWTLFVALPCRIQR